MKAKRKARLKKAPSAVDFIVERISGGRTDLSYYEKRAEARADAKLSRAERVRVFRVKYILVSDSHKKARK